MGMLSPLSGMRRLPTAESGVPSWDWRAGPGAPRGGCRPCWRAFSAGGCVFLWTGDFYASKSLRVPCLSPPCSVVPDLISSVLHTGENCNIFPEFSSLLDAGRGDSLHTPRPVLHRPSGEGTASAEKRISMRGGETLTLRQGGPRVHTMAEHLQDSRSCTRRGPTAGKGVRCCWVPWRWREGSRHLSVIALERVGHWAQSTAAAPLAAPLQTAPFLCLPCSA